MNVIPVIMRALDNLLDLHSMVKSHANNRYKSDNTVKCFMPI